VPHRPRRYGLQRERRGLRALREFDRLAALVTGGGSGIGAATAALLLERGAEVAVLDRDPSGAPDGCRPLIADVSDDAAVKAALGELDRLDVLINNAGIGAIGDVTAQDDAEWHRLLDVNVMGVVRATRAALPLLRRSEHASIVNTSSVLAVVGVPNRALYAASKGALYSLTLAMAADHVKDGIRVNAVAPGTADTPWVGRLLDAADDPSAERIALERRQPIGRLVTAEEVANAIVYLASPLSASTTGTVLGVDGGMGNLRLPT
jgi:NAD(P)-dependent dehydrogenase (short-subunit alcohol dehydrogenase family)